jgi:hypothetical protein
LARRKKTGLVGGGVGPHQDRQLSRENGTFQVHFDDPKTGHSAEPTADRILIWLIFETKILDSADD